MKAVFIGLAVCLLVSKAVAIGHWECISNPDDVEAGIRGIMDMDDHNGDGMLSRSEAEQFDTRTFDHIDGLDKMDGYISDDDLHKFLGCHH